MARGGSVTKVRRRARAAYGAGTLEKRGEGWWLRFSDGVGTDRRRWREGPFRTREEATAHRDRGTRLQGTAATPIDQWLTDWALRTSAELYSLERESDADIKRRHVRLHLAPRLVGIRVGDVRVGDLNLLFRNLVESGLKPKTVANIRGTLSSALGDAVADGLLAFNPVRDAKLPRKHRGTLKGRVAPLALRKVLEPDEFGRVVQWCEVNESVSRWAAPLLLMANTGMRRGEALGLRW